MNNKLLEVIVVNWNTKDLLYNCLNSVFTNNSIPGLSVVVVDNDSTDGSVSMVEASFPQVEIIGNKKNIGFARANNIVLERNDSHYYLLLNSDTYLFPNAISAALKVFDSESKIGLVAPQILNADGSVQHPNYIGFPGLYSEFMANIVPGRIAKGWLPAGKYVEAGDIPREIVHATGACLFIRTEVIKNIGVLDEQFEFSYEDADFCRRAREYGWLIKYCPSSKVTHFGGASTSRQSKKYSKVINKSRYRYFRKYGTIFHPVLLRILDNISFCVWKLRKLKSLTVLKI